MKEKTLCLLYSKFEKHKKQTKQRKRHDVVLHHVRLRVLVRTRKRQAQLPRPLPPAAGRDNAGFSRPSGGVPLRPRIRSGLFVCLPEHPVRETARRAITYVFPLCDFLKSVQERDLRLPWKTNEKHCIHVQRELLESGEKSYRKVFTVWTSKVLLMNQIAEVNPYNTTHFAWVDAGLSKWGRTHSVYTLREYPRNNLYYFKDNEMLYLNESIPLIACFLVATANVWRKLSTLYVEELHQNKYSGIPTTKRLFSLYCPKNTNTCSKTFIFFSCRYFGPTNDRVGACN